MPIPLGTNDISVALMIYPRRLTVNPPVSPEPAHGISLLHSSPRNCWTFYLLANQRETKYNTPVSKLN